MLSYETIFAFATVSVLLALSPGPDNLFVLTQAATQGRRAGLLITFGLCSGLIVHSAAVALGVAAIFKASPLAFNALKLVGAAYLLYLAWQAWCSAAPGHQRQAQPMNGRALYLRGVVMNLSNPKVAIFFLAFLPQFVVPENGSVAGSVAGQIIQLGLVFMLCACLVFATIAFLAGALGAWLRSSQRAWAWLNRMTSVVFVGLALKLAASER